MDSVILVLAIVAPLCGALGVFAAGGRWAERIAFTTLAIGGVVAITVAVAVTDAGAPLLYRLGGWAPPLGVALRADGLSAAMMAVTAVVVCIVGLYARADFPQGPVEARAPLAFWILLLSVWAALNTVFLGGDLFTLYVALELLTFAAVPLVSLDGRADTLQAALRYLLFALFGSVLYLVGTALLYGTCGTLDIVLLSACVHPQTTTVVAVALMTAGLFAKTALFPLHLWLPPAHAGAPAAASAVLSALVVKGSFFIAVRLWFDAAPALPGYLAAQLPALLGGAAILFGSIVALRQERLKLLIAYSTLAQIGYLFLMFPLAFDPGTGALHGGAALAGGIVQAASHATAKAAMFLVAGVAYEALGHDRIAGLAGMGRALPMSVLAFALAGAALIGVPPSGAYLAKTLLLHASAETAQWWWAVVIQAGGVLTSSYVLLVLAHTGAPVASPVTLRAAVPRSREAAALALALGSLLLGLFPWQRYPDFAAAGDVAKDWSGTTTLEALAGTLWPIVLGGALMLVVGRHAFHFDARARLQRMALPFVRTTMHIDAALRQWTWAGVALLLVALMLGGAMWAGR